MQMQSQNFFASIKTASKELLVSRENFISPTTPGTWGTTRAPQERTWCAHWTGDHSKSRWAYRLGELIRLCEKEQRHASAVPRPQRSQPCHQAPTPLHPNIRWCTPKVERTQIFLHSRCQKWLLEYRTWSRQVLVHNLQFTSWQIQIPASPLWSDLRPGHFSKEGRWDLQWPPWRNWHRWWHSHIWKRPRWPRRQP